MGNFREVGRKEEEESVAEEAEEEEEEVAMEAAAQSPTRVRMSRLSNCKATKAWWQTRHFRRNPWPVRAAH